MDTMNITQIKKNIGDWFQDGTDFQEKVVDCMTPYVRKLEILGNDFETEDVLLEYHHGKLWLGQFEITPLTLFGWVTQLNSPIYEEFGAFFEYLTDETDWDEVFRWLTYKATYVQPNMTPFYRGLCYVDKCTWYVDNTTALKLSPMDNHIYECINTVDWMYRNRSAWLEGCEHQLYQAEFTSLELRKFPQCIKLLASSGTKCNYDATIGDYINTPLFSTLSHLVEEQVSLQGGYTQQDFVVDTQYHQPSWWTSVFFPFRIRTIEVNSSDISEVDSDEEFNEELYDIDKTRRRADFRKKRKTDRHAGVSNNQAHTFYGARKRLKFKEESGLLGITTPTINQVTPKEAAAIIEEIVLGVWNTSKSRKWSVLILELYRVVKVACPEYSVVNVLEKQLQWFSTFYEDLLDKTWLEISSEVTSGLRKWQSFSTTKVCHFLSCMVGYGVIALFDPMNLISITQKEFDTLMWRFKNFKHDPTNFITSMWELIDDALSVVRVYKETGSWEAALVRESPYLQLQERISRTKARHVLFKAGNLFEVEKMDEGEHLVEVDSVKTEIVNMMLVIAPALRRGMELELKNLSVMYHEVLESTGAQLTKFKPWCVLILGKSQIGKTVFNQKLVPYACSVMGVPSERKFMYSIPENVNFWDGFKSYKTGLTYDDIANLKALDMSPVANTLLRVVNNEPLNVEQAEIDLKGRVWCNAKVLGCTTNIPSLNLDRMIEEHVAIWNRFRYQIEMEVRPEFKHDTEDKLDSTKMSLRQKSEIFPDTHLYTVYRIRVCSVTNDMKLEFGKESQPFKPDKWKREVVTMDGVRLARIRIYELLPFLTSDIQQHCAEQNSVLTNAKLLDSKFVCDQCVMPLDYCTCQKVCKCGAYKVFGRYTPLCCCHKEPPVLNGIVPDPLVFSLECKICNGIDDGIATCVCDRLPLDEFKTKLMRYAFSPDGFQIQTRSSNIECKVCGTRECATNFEVCRDLNDAVDEWVKPWTMQWHIRQLGMRKPESASVRETFRDDVNAYLHSRLTVLGREVRSLQQIATMESNRFIIEFLEYYFIKIQTWLTFANVVWPFALVDPSSPNYHETLMNTRAGTRTLKMCMRTLRCASFGITLFLTSFIYGGPRMVAPVACGLAISTQIYMARRCLQLIPFVVPFCGIANRSVFGRTIMLGVFSLIVENRVSSVIEDKFTLGCKYALSNNLIPRFYAWCVDTHKVVLDMWNYRSNRVSTKMAEIVSVAREKMMDDPWFHVVATHGPSLVQKATAARTIRLLVHHWRDLVRGYGMIPNAGFEVSLNEALAKAHKYADESYIIAYQNSLEDSSLDNVQNDHLVATVQRQTYCMTTVGKMFSQCVAVDTNVLLFPAHSFVHGLEVVVVRRRMSVGVKNATFSFVMDNSKIIHVKGDIMFYSCASVGTVKNLVKHFAQEKPAKGVYFDICSRVGDGNIEDNIGTFICDTGMTESSGMYNGKYIVTACFDYMANFGRPGMSGSPLVSVVQPSRIVGIHIGSFEGNGNRAHSAAWLPTDGFVVSSVIPNHSMFPLPNSGRIPHHRYGEKVIVHGISEKSILFRIGEGNFAYHGRTTHLSTYNDLDGIVPTQIAEEVTAEFGNKQYGSPKLRGPNGNDNALKWIADLNDRFNGAHELPGEVLEWALMDYLKNLPVPTDKDTTDFQPLNKHEILNGRVGVHGMDSMNFSGSVGEPYNKPLRDFCIQFEHEVGLQYSFTDDMFWDEVERVKQKYVQGVRAYPLFAMFPKIEPTPLTKDKVRMILNPELSNKLLAREVLMAPICYLERYRTQTECYVGICPYSKEWDQFYRCFTNKRRCFAMDYSGYDKCMNAQVSVAVYTVFWFVLNALNYPPEFYSYVQGLCADACYPLVAVAGEVIELRSSFTSGSVETSVRNSIANSLLLRSAYLLSYLKNKRYFSPVLPPPFQQMVFLAVYGDDNVGCIAKNCYWFNMRLAQQALKPFEYVLTDADKSSVVPLYVDAKNVDFLKRRFIYNKELGYVIGALSEESILKRLVSVIKPKAPNTLREILLQNIDSALDEWAFWGRAIYENRRKRMMDILEKTGGRLKPVTLGMTYDERVSRLQAMGN